MKPEDMLNIFLNQIRALRNKFLKQNRPQLTPLDTKRTLPPIKGVATDDPNKLQHRRTKSMFFKEEPVNPDTFQRNSYKPATLKEKSKPLPIDLKEIKNSFVKSASLNVNKLASSKISNEEKDMIKKIIEEKIEKVKTEFRIPQKTFNAEINMLKTKINTRRFYIRDLKELQLRSQSNVHLTVLLKFKSSKNSVNVLKGEENLKRRSSKRIKCLNEIEQKFGILSGRK
jgi:hypothetical protein